MGLKKGMTNNPAGRPVGAVNKVTASLRNRINDFLNENWENLQKDFEKLEPKDRLMFMEKLLQYALPKIQSVELASTQEQSETEDNKYIRDLIETYRIHAKNEVSTKTK